METIIYNIKQLISPGKVVKLVCYYGWTVEKRDSFLEKMILKLGTEEKIRLSEGGVLSF